MDFDLDFGFGWDNYDGQGFDLTYDGFIESSSDCSSKLSDTQTPTTGPPPPHPGSLPWTPTAPSAPSVPSVPSAPSHRRTNSASAAFPGLPFSHVRQLSAPLVGSRTAVETDEFGLVCADGLVTFNPVELGFIPESAWQDRKYTFGELVVTFFQQKSSGHTRFLHKLYNALRIVELDPFYSTFIGLEWVSDRILKVNKRVFGRLLGIRAIDGAFFHQQGNFPSHGFREIGPGEADGNVNAEDLDGVDFDEVRLLTHVSGILRRSSPGPVFLAGKWRSGWQTE
jgi:hypothetical protein